MLFTSEQVSAGHPDKICDQIADAIVTDCLRHDRDSRVAVECMIKDCMIFIAGEITSTHAPDYEALSREVLTRVGDPIPKPMSSTRWSPARAVTSPWAWTAAGLATRG